MHNGATRTSTTLALRAFLFEGTGHRARCKCARRSPVTDTRPYSQHSARISLIAASPSHTTPPHLLPSISSRKTFPWRVYSSHIPQPPSISEWAEPHPELWDFHHAISVPQPFTHDQLSHQFSAYQTLKDTNGLLSLVPRDVYISFAEALATHTLKLHKARRPEAFECATMLKGVLDDLMRAQSQEKLFPLSAIAYIALGDLEQAQRHLCKTYTEVAFYPFTTTALYLLMEDSVKRKDTRHTFIFILDTWGVLASYVFGDRAKRLLASDGPEHAIQLRVIEFFRSIPSPADLVIAFAPSLSETHMGKAIRVLSRFLSEEGRADEAFFFIKTLEGKVSKGGAIIEVPRLTKYLIVRSLVHQDRSQLALEAWGNIDIPPQQDRTASRQHAYTGLVLSAGLGDAEQAQSHFRVLESFGQPSQFEKLTLLNAYSEAGDTVQLMQTWKNITDPGEIAPKALYDLLARTHARKGNVEEMQRWHERMKQAGHIPDVYSFAALLTGCAATDDIEGVERVLDEMQRASVKPNNTCFTIIISLLATRKDPISAERALRSMEAFDVLPDVKTLNSLMLAHIQGGSWKGVVRVFDYIESLRRKGRFSHGVDVYNVLLKALVKIGAPFAVVSRFLRRLDEARVRPNEYTWALMIQSASDAHRMDIAMAFFKEMDAIAEQTGSKEHITVWTLTNLLNGFLRTRNRDGAKEVYDEMLRRGIEPGSTTYAGIMRSYAYEGTEESLQLAEEFLKSLKEDVVPKNPDAYRIRKGPVTGLFRLYSALLEAYTHLQRPEDVERLYQEAVQQDQESGLGMLTLLLDCHRRTGQIETVKHIWPKLYAKILRTSRTDLFRPTSEDLLATKGPLEGRVNVRAADMLCIPLAIYIDALSRAGQHLEIPRVWTTARDAGFAFDPVNWNQLSVALVRAGEVEHAFEILERIILPQSQRVKPIQRSRDKNPHDALVFHESDDGVKLEDSMFRDKTHSKTSPARQSTQQRSFKGYLRDDVASFTPDQDADQETGDDASPEVDFAHPLHMLSQLMPVWTTWRIHATTAAHLGWAIKLLQNGYVVRPWPSEERQTRTRGNFSRVQLAELDPEAAHTIMINIKDKFPNSLAEIRTWMRRRRSRFMMAKVGATFGMTPHS